MKHSKSCLVVLSSVFLLFFTPCLSQEWTDTGLQYLTHIEVCPDNQDIVYASSYLGIYKSIDGGNTWSQLIDEIRSDEIIIHPIYTDTIFATVKYEGNPEFYDGGLIMSADGGNTWNYIAKANAEEIFIGICFYPSVPDTMFARTNSTFGGRLLKSIDAGTNWDTISVPNASNCKSLEFDLNNHNTIYTASSNCNFLFKSHDCGHSWAQTAKWQDEHSPQNLAIHPLISNILYVTMENYLLKSEDGGLSWIIHDSSSTDVYRKLIIDPQQPQRMILNKGGGISITFNDGQSWQSIDYNLDTLTISVIHFDSHLRKLYCSTTQDWGKTYSLDYDDIALFMQPSENKPVQFRLYPNYPNPFNNTTTIPFVIEKHTKVEISIYDLTGSKIRTLVSDTYPPGSYSIGWNGFNESGEAVPTGVYLIRMTSGVSYNSYITKCVLLK